MVSAMANPERVAVIPLVVDSTGREIVPSNAILHGSYTTIAERIVDSKQRRECLRLVNEADSVREEKRALAAMREEIAARADAVTQAETLIRQLCDQVNTLTARVDAFEEEQRAKAEEEEQAKASVDDYSLPLGATDPDEAATSDPDDPPGAGDAGDETHGELITHPPTAPEDREQLGALEDDEGPSSYVKGEGDLPAKLTKEVPPEPGTEPEFPEPRQPSARNPVGVSW
jgi:hypothetical protein